jgi:hypothetical protein
MCFVGERRAIKPICWRRSRPSASLGRGPWKISPMRARTNEKSCELQRLDDRQRRRQMKSDG